MKPLIKFLVRKLASDGVSVKEKWTVYATDKNHAGTVVQADPRITSDTDYAITEDTTNASHQKISDKTSAQTDV